MSNDSRWSAVHHFFISFLCGHCDDTRNVRLVLVSYPSQIAKGPLHNYVMLEMAFFDPPTHPVTICNVSIDPPQHYVTNIFTNHLIFLV